MATPKLNNYQSLHTTVVPTGLEVPAPGRRPTRPSSTLFPIEVQIRWVALGQSCSCLVGLQLGSSLSGSQAGLLAATSCLCICYSSC